MSKELKGLLAAADAAGYALAPPTDETTVPAKRHVEAAFRDGHHAAALKPSTAVAKVASAPTLTVRPATHWLHATLTSLLPNHRIPA